MAVATIDEIAKKMHEAGVVDPKAHVNLVFGERQVTGLPQIDDGTGAMSFQRWQGRRRIGSDALAALMIEVMRVESLHIPLLKPPERDIMTALKEYGIHRRQNRLVATTAESRRNLNTLSCLLLLAARAGK